ncbi:acyltransferase [Flavipsychrobacter stenotrophus]|uniref:Acyltransferase n=1 Tax=Flavipsychrobacter stenotrophus TaxID=2077091 RepID=A0A2S7T184_9BACT|nr:acyltransferase [Flavipsychrobacter stenotrophus]PQJ12724.1 acyltransferase [Flavipsychrobacter stenotrophus]
MPLVTDASRSDLNIKRLPALDMLRCVAIIIVFFWHYHQYGSPSWVAAVGRFGWSGVDLFFVLSGFLIGSQLMQEAAKGNGIRFKDFYLRRAFRILPSFLLVLGIYYFVPQFREREGLAPLWRYLTFTQNFGLDLRTNGTFSHAWSLCIEEQFYLFLPLLLLFVSTLRLNKLVPWLLLGIFLSGFVLRYYSWTHFVAPAINTEQNGGIEYYRYIYYPTYNRLDGLLAGVTIAAIMKFRPLLWKGLNRFANLILAGGLFLLGYAYIMCADKVSLKVAVFGYPLVSVAYGLIVLAAVSTESVLSRIRTPLFGLPSTLAYCIYLTHKQLNHIVRRALSDKIDDEGNLMFLICIVVGIAGGWLLHSAIEKPFLLLRDKILKQK